MLRTQYVPEGPEQILAPLPASDTEQDHPPAEGVAQLARGQEARAAQREREEEAARQQRVALRRHLELTRRAATSLHHLHAVSTRSRHDLTATSPRSRRAVPR